jgi:hypothetical protein
VCTEFSQKELDFRWALEPVARGGRLRLLTNDDADAAVLQGAEGILIREIVRASSFFSGHSNSNLCVAASLQ